MAKFIIEGGHKLEGEVVISGMKNAATPIIAATLLTDEECVIDNVPQINDVLRILEILEGLGVKIKWLGNNKLSIHCQNIGCNSLDKKIVASMRSSVLLLGPALARCRQIVLPKPGGCIIGNRPLGTHFHALRCLGADIRKQGEEYCLETSGLKGANIILPEFSVTATENALMAAVLAQGKTTIKLAAAEPHVQDLINFLCKMGAKIWGRGSHTLLVEGVSKLRGANYTIIPDQIEAGTFAVLAAATKSSIILKKIVPEHLELVLFHLKKIGIDFKIGGGELRLNPASALSSFRLQTMPYPGFPTDLQAPFGVLATQCAGTSLIHDPLFEGRMGYVRELIKMGANAIECDPHRVRIIGPTPLFGREIDGLDLRAGATLVVAGLVAEGKTIIHNAEILDRGYEKLDEKLRALGAKIRRE